jgi:SOS-response transcriptional repressor LexA
MTRRDIAQKLKQLRAASGVSQRVAAQAIGRSQQTLGSWETGVGQPDIDTLMRLLRFYNSSADEAFGLFMQKGITQKEIEFCKKLRVLDDFGRRAVTAVLDVEHLRCVENRQTKTLVLPFPIQKASAGQGNYLDDDWAESLAVLQNDLTGRADFLLRVAGDSMQPLYAEDDILLIRQTDTVNDEEIGVFLLEGELLVKKLRGGNLVSLNPRYPDYPCGEYCVCRGQVLGKLAPDWIVHPKTQQT